MLIEMVFVNKSDEIQRDIYVNYLKVTGPPTLTESQETEVISGIS